VSGVRGPERKQVRYLLGTIHPTRGMRASICHDFKDGGVVLDEVAIEYGFMMGDPIPQHPQSIGGGMDGIPADRNRGSRRKIRELPVEPGSPKPSIMAPCVKGHPEREFQISDYFAVVRCLFAVVTISL
jgi:hypothetical protein